MLWLGTMKKRSTPSREEMRAIALVYARDAHLRRVSNRWGAGAPDPIPPVYTCFNAKPRGR